MFEYASRSAIAAVDLDTVEGQVSALRMAAPVVARIRDRAMRPEYARRLSGWLGMDERTVLRAVHDAARAEGREARPRPGEERPAPQRAGERSEEHTSELQSRGHLVCRLLIEKKY